MAKAKPAMGRFEVQHKDKGPRAKVLYPAWSQRTAACRIERPNYDEMKEHMAELCETHNRSGKDRQSTAAQTNMRR